MESAETVVVGAGIVGLCSALALARRTSGRVVVVEKGSGLGEGSTGASSAICRHRYSLDAMVALARDGIAAYRNWPDFLGVSRPAGRFCEDGVLWLGETGFPAQAEADRLRRLGVAAEALDETAVRERFPAISLCPLGPDLATGAPHACPPPPPSSSWLFEENGGHFDPDAALGDLSRALAARGVEVRLRTAVESVKVASGRVEGVLLADGRMVACANVLNATGPWCDALLRPLGLDARWPLRPTRIQIALVDRPAALPGALPVCADLAAGIYFRTDPSGRQIVVGSLLPEDEEEEVADPDSFDTQADADFVRAKLHALQHRLPALDRLSGVRGYSGLYTMNRRDMHPVVGPTPVQGLYMANGFSGHGFKLAPAVGALAAQAISGVRLPTDPDVDAGLLAFDRRALTGGFASVLA